MVRVFTAVLLFSSLTTAASANWEYTRWGMTAQQVIEASGGSAHAMPADHRFRDEADHYEITVEARSSKPPRGEIGFQFDLPGGGLRCVILNAMGDDADTMETILVQRYGAPIDDSSFGPLRTLQWRTPDSIELAMNSSPKAAVVNHCAPGRS